MKAPFQEEEGGGFLGMSDNPSVHVDTVVHKATIEVNEEGTVAAAATGAVMTSRCLPPPHVDVVVDRPFLFTITSQDGALLFISKVVNPTLSGISAGKVEAGVAEELRSLAQGGCSGSISTWAKLASKILGAAIETEKAFEKKKKLADRAAVVGASSWSLLGAWRYLDDGAYV